MLFLQVFNFMKIKNSLRQRSNLKEWPTNGKEEIVLKLSNSFWGSPQTACKIYTNSFTVKQDVPEKSSLSKAYLFPYSVWTVGTSYLCTAFRFEICISIWSLNSWVEHICVWLGCFTMKFKAGSMIQRSR